MIVSQRLVRMYPGVALWICDNLPKVRNKPKVFKAFQRYAKLNERVAERSLKHGPPPEIDYRRIVGASGEFLPSKWANTVFVSEAICERFTNSESDARDPRMHRLLEATLLHEIVHWGDWLEDKEHEPGIEQGAAFEKEAYGAVTERYWSD